LETEFIFNFTHNLLNRTFRTIKTRDRTVSIPQWLEPVKIWRVENSTLFHRYSNYKDDLVGKYHGPNPADIAVVDPPPITHQNLPPSVRDELQSEISEQYLFHGTSPQGALGIYKSGFDPRRAGSAAGSLYGAGLYLAECSSKSDEYAVADEDGIYAGHCALLLCRVALGSTLTWEAESDVAKINSEMERGRFDSFLGDREKLRGTYREFVLPARCYAGAYPEYIIIYKRRYDALRSTANLSPRPSPSSPSARSSPAPSRSSGPTLHAPRVTPSPRGSPRSSKGR